MSETPDGPQSHPKSGPFDALEARAVRNVEDALAELAAVRAARREAAPPVPENIEQARRKAQWKANMRRLGLVAAIGTGLGYVLRFIRNPVASAAVSGTCTAGLTALTIVLIPGLCEADTDRSAPPPPAPTATAPPRPGETGTSPAPTSPPPSGTPTLSPSPSLTVTDPATGAPVISPDPEPGTPPVGDTSPPPDIPPDGEPEEPPAEEPPPAPPGDDCLIHLNLPGIVEVCLL
jgi:hypothetical protein